MRHGISREKSLVLQALRAFFSGENKRLESALDEQIDWPSFVRFAEQHSILPLVAYALREQCGVVPPEVREQLRQRLLLASRNNLALIHEWSQLLRAFDEAKISVISMKGPALALLAYPNFALREFGDLDLLVRPEEVPQACDLLVRNGYRLSSSLAADTYEMPLYTRNSQLEFVHSERRICVDLHWGALHEMFSFQLPVDLLFESARIEHREGISFLSLSPEDLLLYLCAHGTKHCWRSLRWLCDIACHLQASPNLNWQSCFRTAQASNCDLVLKHALLLAHHVLDVDLPLSTVKYCSCPDAQNLAGAAMSRLLREDLRPDEELRFHLAFTKGWRNRIRFIFERLFVPDEPGLFEQHLPGSLRFLGYPVKPTRFVFLHLRRLVGGRI